jgi:hypothetical protein
MGVRPNDPALLAVILRSAARKDLSWIDTPAQLAHRREILRCAQDDGQGRVGVGERSEAEPETHGHRTLTEKTTSKKTKAKERATAKAGDVLRRCAQDDGQGRVGVRERSEAEPETSCGGPTLLAAIETTTATTTAAHKITKAGIEEGWVGHSTESVGEVKLWAL